MRVYNTFLDTLCSTPNPSWSRLNCMQQLHIYMLVACEFAPPMSVRIIFSIVSSQRSRAYAQIFIELNASSSSMRCVFGRLWRMRQRGNVSRLKRALSPMGKEAPEARSGSSSDGGGANTSTRSRNAFLVIIYIILNVATQRTALLFTLCSLCAHRSSVVCRLVGARCAVIFHKPHTTKPLRL